MDQSLTERPMRVYRGASPDDLDLPTDPVGHEWTDPGYASTATSRRIAENSFAGKGRVLLTVQVPEGTPALQIDGLGETEVLLGRGQRWRVVADHGLTPSGARHLEVELQGQPTREERIEQLMLAGLTRDEAEAQLRKGVRRSADPDDEDLTDDDAPGPEEVGDEDEDFDDETLSHIHALLDEEDDDYPEAQRADLTLGGERLHRYWTIGKGLRKWLGHPHPWTSLYRHLRKYVGSERAKRMAARWVHEVTGNWPGSDAHRVATGHRPRGHRIGPG